MLFTGNVQGAKHAVLVGVVFLSIGICLTLPVTLSLSSIAPRIFTSDPCLLNAIFAPMFVLTVVSSFDWIRIPLEGVARGSGKQLLGSIINLLCYLAIAMPLGIVLTIVAGLGAIGYWIGLTSGGFLQCVLYAVMLLSMNWRKESEKAWRMAGKESEHSQESDHELQASAAPAAAEITTETHSTAFEGNSDLVLQESASKIHEKSSSSEQNTEPLLLAAEGPSSTGNISTNSLSATVFTHYDHENLNLNLAAASDADTDDSDATLLLSETGDESSEAESVVHENCESVNDKVEETAHSTVRIPLQTVVLRVITVVAMFVLLAVSVVVSQLYVYQSSIGPCLPEHSTLNVTANITHNATANTTNAYPACTAL